MEYILMVLVLVTVIAALIILKFLNLSVGLTTVIILLIVMSAIYSLARVQSKEVDNSRDIGNKID